MGYGLILLLAMFALGYGLGNYWPEIKDAIYKRPKFDAKKQNIYIKKK